MASQVFTIAKDEWRYWRRSRLIMSVMIIAVLLAVASVVVTSANMAMEAEHRQKLQSESEQTFVEQPDRHPHRMVHYGHYLFRAPPPLGRLDPGIDSYTGTSIFLEGHRQNGATFAEQQQSSGLNWLGTLSPAFVMQVLSPLLLIVMGYGVMTREREAGTFEFLKVQGTSPLVLIAGKGLALVTAGLVVLTPLIVGALFSLVAGASLLTVTAFIAGYLLYLAIWCVLVLLVSTLSATSSTSFSWLIAIWILFCLILPRIASNTATILVESPGKLETDFAVLAELRKHGDGHNANDPAFRALKDNLLTKYNVDSVEQLPVNFKGVVAQESETKLTEVLNHFAEQQMAEAQQQAFVARWFGWFSPLIAIQTTSMKLAGTDLENYQRFLRQAESVRFDFVQSLNKLHAEALTYEDDNNKYKNRETQQKAKISSDNWQILNDFHFSPLSAAERLRNSLSGLLQLLTLLLVALGLTHWAGRRV
jgi:ABC-2 type transport system permease protein